MRKASVQLPCEKELKADQHIRINSRRALEQKQGMLNTLRSKEGLEAKNEKQLTKQRVRVASDDSSILTRLSESCVPTCQPSL